MTTRPGLEPEELQPQHLLTRIVAVEQRQLRFMRMWIATHLTSPTSTPTGPIGHTSTAATALSLRRRLSPASIWRLAREHMPKLLGWVAEKVLQYLLPLLVSFGLAGWALLRRSGIAVADWFAGWWLWLLQLLHVAAS